MKIILDKKQKELLGEITGNLAVALLTIGAIAPFFDRQFPKGILLNQLLFSFILGTIFIVSSLTIVKK